MSQDEDVDVEVVRIRPSTDIGPFWEPDQFLSDDFDELHRWLGISRETYDETVAWSDRWDFRGHETDPSYEPERQRLVAKLQAEAHEGIHFD